MANFSTLGQICQQPDFQQRVAVAMAGAAINIYTELNTVSGHAQRALFATKVVTGNYNLPAACLAVMQSATIAAEATGGTVGNSIPDADIQTQVSGIWNALAGA